MTAPAWKDCRRAVHVRSFLMQMLHFVQHDNVGVQHDNGGFSVTTWGVSICGGSA